MKPTASGYEIEAGPRRRWTDEVKDELVALGSAANLKSRLLGDRLFSGHLKTQELKRSRIPRRKQ